MKKLIFVLLALFSMNSFAAEVCRFNGLNVLCTNEKILKEIVKTYPRGIKTSQSAYIVLNPNYDLLAVKVLVEQGYEPTALGFYIKK